MVHQDSLPSEITFVVQRPPSLGVLQKVQPRDRTWDLHGPGRQQQLQGATTFTQEDVNQGKIFYQQQAAGGTNDSLLLEATNGVTKVGNIRLEMDIVPELLPLKVRRDHCRS